MAHLKFDVYEANEVNTNAMLVRTIELDTETDAPAKVEGLLKEVRELHADKKTHVSVNGELAAWVLLKRKTGGRRVELAPDVVKRIHELYVLEDHSVATINLPIFSEFKGLVVSANISKAVLAQERDLDVEGIDDLRVAAKAKMDSGTTGRQKHSEADKAEWVRLHLEENMSGSAIGKQKGINSATINAHLKKEGVQQNSRGRTKQVVAEQVA